jgi:hypothetical protein
MTIVGWPGAEGRLVNIASRDDELNIVLSLDCIQGFRKITERRDIA